MWPPSSSLQKGRLQAGRPWIFSISYLSTFENFVYLEAATYSWPCENAGPSTSQTPTFFRVCPCIMKFSKIDLTKKEFAWLALIVIAKAGHTGNCSRVHSKPNCSMFLGKRVILGMKTSRRPPGDLLSRMVQWRIYNIIFS